MEHHCGLIRSWKCCEEEAGTQKGRKEEGRKREGEERTGKREEWKRRRDV